MGQSNGSVSIRLFGRINLKNDKHRQCLRSVSLLHRSIFRHLKFEMHFFVFVFLSTGLNGMGFSGAGLLAWVWDMWTRNGRVYCYGGLQAQSLCEASIHGSAVQGIQLDLNSKNSFGLLLHSCVSWFTTETTGPTV